MTDAFTIKNYSILTSLNKTEIYIKMIDTVAHMTYETSVDNNELRLSLTLDDIYKIIASCFAEDEGYKVAITVKSGIMKTKFHAVIAGFLKIDFDILIKEKIMTNDSQLTLFVNQLEEKQETIYEALSKRCNELFCLLETQKKEYENKIRELENTVNVISNAEIEIRMNTFVSINVQALVIQGDAHVKQDKICLLYKLQKINFTSFSFADLSSFRNTSLKELTIDATGNTKFISLKGLDGFPNLETLIIINPSCLKDFSILYKNNHKIKSIKLPGQTSVNVNELKTYCNENKIIVTI